MIDSEGAIENCTKMVYKAMIDKNKTPISLQFFVPNDWMNLQFLTYLSTYLNQKKAKKVDHVNLDIFVEEKE